MTSPDVHAGEPDLASLGALLTDRTRAAICLALLDGRAWTASEVARLAGAAPSTATSHLNRLVAGGLLAQERRGRHRSVRLADSGTAEMIEALAARTPGLPRQQPRAVMASVITTARESPRWRSTRGQRRPQPAGAVAAAVFHRALEASFRRALEASWLVHGDGSRVVRLTDQGRDAFRRHLGLADEVLTTG